MTFLRRYSKQSNRSLQYDVNNLGTICKKHYPSLVTLLIISRDVNYRRVKRHLQTVIGCFVYVGYHSFVLIRFYTGTDCENACYDLSIVLACS